MYIYELNSGDTVTVTVICENKAPMEFKSTVVKNSAKSRCVLLVPITSDGKVIGFGSDAVHITATTLIDGKVMQWRGCHIQYIKANGNAYHALICSNTGAFINRRGAFRVPIDEYCYVNNGKMTVDALCLNVSNTGFAFVVGQYDGSPMDHVRVSYHDNLLNIEVNLEGRVVRVEDKGNGSTLFGCKLIPNNHIGRYVSLRQRKMASLRKGG